MSGSRPQRILLDLNAAINAAALYGTGHPHAEATLAALFSTLSAALAEASPVTVGVAGSRVLVQGQPTTAAAIAHPLAGRLRRRGVEQVSFARLLESGELAAFMADLVAVDDRAVVSRSHIQAARVELTSRDLGRGLATDVTGEVPSGPLGRVAVVGRVLADAGRGARLATADLESVIAEMLAAMDEDPSPLAHLAAWDWEGTWPAVHAHNTAALAVAMARDVGVSRAGCMELGLAGLLHDIGRVTLPPAVLERDLNLTDEIELILDHPATGFEVLLGAPDLPPIALVVAFEHHLGYNGTGHPRLPRPRRPHPATRLIAVADCFDVLYTARVGSGRAAAEDTVDWLSERAGTLLDPAWTQAFVALLET